jgi:hypothetical protein
MVLGDTGIHTSKSINQLGNPLNQRLTNSMAKAGARWKKLQEWPKVKVASHSAEWSFVYEEPRISTLPMFVACGRGCLPHAFWNGSSALIEEIRI